MLTFTNSPGSLFGILAKCGLLIKQAKTYQTAQQPNYIDTTNGLVAQLNAYSDIQALVGNAYISQLNQAGSTPGNLAVQVAQRSMNRLVFLDNPRIAQNLQAVNILDSINEVIRQMNIAGASILAMTITATPNAFTGVGNGIVNVSTRRPQDGRVLENSFSELVQFECTDDSYIGGAIAGNEGFTVTGVGNEPGAFDFNWPLGSNASTQLNAIGVEDVGSGNILTNSSYDEWTSNVPDNFDLVVGVAGTNIAEETSITFDPPPNSSMRIIGDGSTLTEITQEFDSGDGTSGTLDPLTQYSFNVFVRRDGVAPAAGVWEVSLVDEGNNVVQDQAGVDNLFTIDLTSLTTNFASYTGIFRTPLVMPDTVYLRQRLSTALTTGRSVYFDHMSLGEMTQLYTSGPYFAVHSGSINFIETDYATCQITNSRGAGGTLSTFAVVLLQCFPMILSNEILFPSSSTPTIQDAWITFS